MSLFLSSSSQPKYFKKIVHTVQSAHTVLRIMQHAASYSMYLGLTSADFSVALHAAARGPANADIGLLEAV